MSDKTSDIFIDSWIKKKQVYEKLGKPKEHFDNALSGYKASIILGRDFGESGESYINRKGLKKFMDWKP